LIADLRCNFVPQIRLGLRFEGVRETDAQADKEGEEWRKATKVKLGTDFEACTKVMLGNNRAQVRAETDTCFMSVPEMGSIC